MRKACLLLMLLGLMLLIPAAVAEPAVSFQPENPRQGDYVDVTVTPDREGARGVIWSLATAEETVFTGKETDRFTASFRPRTEADHVLTVTVVYGKDDAETVSVTVPVSGAAPLQEGPDVIYSQRDGWWHDKVYSARYKRSVEQAGCALFALSHLLHRMGYSGEEVQPDQLAVRFRSCYVEGRGTANEILLDRAGEIWHFSASDELIETEAGLRLCFTLGDRFSFSVVNGHIAFADQLSEDGTKVHVIDSAPSATWERIGDTPVYIRNADGAFERIASPDELSGIRWFFETGEYGGAEYWLDLAWCAGRGMRFIRPSWMTLTRPDSDISAEPEYAGCVWSRVTAGGESLLVRTRDLRWAFTGTEGLRIARVTKRNTSLDDDAGKHIPGYKALQPGTLVFVLADSGDGRLYVFYKGSFGYLPRDHAELLAVDPDSYPTGFVSVNGKTRGTAEVAIRISPDNKARSYYSWVIGTPVTILKEQSGFYLAEGGGLQGWIKKEYFTPDDPGETE